MTTCTMKQTDNGQWTISATGFSEGMVRSMINSMRLAAEQNETANEVYEFLKDSYNKEKN